MEKEKKDWEAGHGGICVIPTLEDWKLKEQKFLANLSHRSLRTILGYCFKKRYAKLLHLLRLQSSGIRNNNNTPPQKNHQQPKKKQKTHKWCKLRAASYSGPQSWVSGFKNTCCPSWGLEASPQHSHRVASSHLQRQFPIWHFLLATIGTWTDVAYTQTDPHTHTCKSI